MVYSAEFDIRIPSSPRAIAEQALDKCIGPSHVAASGEGCYADEDWVRDLSFEALTILASGKPEWIQAIPLVLNSFLDQSPHISYRHTPYLHRVPGHIPNPFQHETEVPLTKKLLNPENFVGENNTMADTFLILLVAGEYLTSVNVWFGDRTKLWSEQKEHMKLFYRHIVDNKSGLMSKNGLITESALASRMDGIKKSGNVLLTNVNWYRTLVSLGEAARQMTDYKWADELSTRAEKLKQIINDTFWNPAKGCYDDWVDKQGNKHDFFESSGNFWAILSGIADRVQADQICDYVRDHGMISAVSGLVATVDKPYPPEYIDRTLRLVHLANWYNVGGEEGMYWPENTSLFSSALQKIGRYQEATRLISALEQIICKHGTLYEVHDHNGCPTKAKCIFGITYPNPADFGMALADYLGYVYGCNKE